MPHVGYHDWEEAKELFGDATDGFQIVEGNIDPDNIYFGFDREKFPPPTSAGLQEGFERHYAGDGLIPKLVDDPYGILWSLSDLHIFGYTVGKGSLTTYHKVGSARGEKLDSMMQAWLLDFVVNPSESAKGWQLAKLS